MGPCPLHPDGLWRIGVQDPAKTRGRVVATVHHSACSAVTSGIYERYLKKDGHTYHHIIDPRTGHPSKPPWRESPSLPVILSWAKSSQPGCSLPVTLLRGGPRITPTFTVPSLFTRITTLNRSGLPMNIK